ncbi:AAA family ATPase [Aspergillus lucknowensis]|uniref:P-loop containing nucleoside triphosphate hydrolase protein n=1 Tax=Aspergillus lucknowensis TaxID=176173 RepID=A0ABR4LRV3_9EURO
MTASPPVFDRFDLLSPLLARTEDDPRPVVLMTCGMAGSGKSTLSRWILSNHPSFKRFSIDAYVYSHHGLYGVDYPKEKYNDFLDEAEDALRVEFTEVLREGSHDAILDFSFAFRETRDEWRSLIEESGARWVLVYLDVRADELWRRITTRNQLAVKDGDSSFFITEEIFKGYLAGFERPSGEGEVVLRLASGQGVVGAG